MSRSGIRPAACVGTCWDCPSVIQPIILLLLGFLSTASFADAQSFRGSIVGTVFDQTQAPVPGAAITAKNQATALTRTAVTDGAGNYAIPQLPIGVYSV